MQLAGSRNAHGLDKVRGKCIIRTEDGMSRRAANLAEKLVFNSPPNLLGMLLVTACSAVLHLIAQSGAGGAVSLAGHGGGYEVWLAAGAFADPAHTMLGRLTCNGGVILALRGLYAGAVNSGRPIRPAWLLKQ